ncbi:MULTISPECIES: shikimate dehydrogenase [unclassified Romboutsia]|uniref:shikimate dehydrogenase n=1 Tax=unclassified Romboutsia TaxID=2626894 RepID=UPI0008218BA6|nr:MULTISPECIES: shikimate dehydrogenase [unclassified Romboutsia]SCH10621.1 Quinate/shikimate dehydrogenase [uncultured Clostridium sp.]
MNSKTKTFCLLGHPVEQSFSPNIHNYLFDKYKINNVYVCYDVIPSEIENAIKGIKALNILGCNITIPHKVEVIKYLDEIEINAKLIGAVNTIKNEGGRLKGYNTDGKGFVKSILDKGYDLKNKKIMIIGAGGACRSIAVELASNDVESIEIRNRSKEKALEIINIINNNFNTKATLSNDTIMEDNLEHIDILINTTPIGMGNDECPINQDIVVNKKMLVCDIVYKPHETTFIKWALKNKLNVVYGIDMLINQGLEAFNIWTDINTTIEDKNQINEIYLDSIK